MKKSIFLLLGLLLSGTLAAQVVRTQARASGVMAKPERYLYAELIGSDRPAYKGYEVIFDFGQATTKWSYNYITDENGLKIRFNSMVEALNYMVRQQWEFVQAYSTLDGDTAYIHYLLRIRVEEIPAALRRQLPPVPNGVSDAGDEATSTPAKAE